MSLLGSDLIPDLTVTVGLTYSSRETEVLDSFRDPNIGIAERNHACASGWQGIDVDAESVPN